MKWNENLSNELKKLNTIKKPSAQQQQRIATLKGVKQSAGGVVRNPKYMDQTGQTVNDNIQTTGAITDPQDLVNQAGKTFNPADPYFQNLYKDTYTNTYNLGTAGLAERQARDLEEAKQEAANRGLPYDPSNRESAYGKAIGGVTDRYDDLYKTATNQAYLAANDTYATQGGLANQGFDSFMQGVLGISQANAQAIANGTASEAVKKDYAAKMAALRKSGSPSSSGTPAAAPGFEIV